MAEIKAKDLPESLVTEKNIEKMLEYVGVRSGYSDDVYVDEDEEDPNYFFVGGDIEVRVPKSEIFEALGVVRHVQEDMISGGYDEDEAIHQGFWDVFQDYPERIEEGEVPWRLIEVVEGSVSNIALSVQELINDWGRQQYEWVEVRGNELWEWPGFGTIDMIARINLEIIGAIPDMEGVYKQQGFPERGFSPA